MLSLDTISRESAILLALSAILLAGFLMTRLTKKLKLPHVSGYIIAGILIGPHMLNVIEGDIVKRMGFVSDIALAFIAFGVGRFFQKKNLRHTGWPVLIITLMESLVAGLLITLTMYYGFNLDLDLSLLLGAIATATAPASTVMTINQYHARGEFVNILLQVVALDDVVCLLLFSVVEAVVDAGHNGGFSLVKVATPVVFNLFTMGVGGFFAIILTRLLSPPSRSKDNRLIITIALLLGLSGLCALFDVSPLLACMAFGALYINKAKDKELYEQLNVFTPPIMLLFFVVSGMNLDVGLLGSLGAVGVAYFLTRIVGKYIGAYLGCLIGKTSGPIRNYLGVALIPQAGVSIGLAYLGKRILPDTIGNLLMTIILASSVLYELLGPASAKFALFKAGTIQTDAPAAPPKADEPVPYDFSGP